MQRDINTVTLSGRLTKAPKLYDAGAENVYTLLRVAINGGRSKGGEEIPAIFYDVKVWNGAAKACVEYIDKGSRVAVEGRLEQYERPENAGQWNHVVAEGVSFLDPKRVEETEPVTTG